MPAKAYRCGICSCDRALVSVRAGVELYGRCIPDRCMRRRAFDATTHESDVRDGSHGLLVWAVGIVLGAFLAISTASSLVGAATGVAATGVAAASSTGDLVTDRLLRSDKPPAQPITGETRAEIGRLSRRSGDFAGRCSGRQNCN